MEKIIETLKDYAKQVIDNKDIDIIRRYLIQREILEAIADLEYANKLCKENNLKLGD